MFDKEVTRQQIQSLNDIEAIVAFFAYLGYDTNSRIQQTSVNLGITSEITQRQIKRIERIADQQGLLSVYLIEMTSVTVAGIQGIIRPLRNRAGQYLFVLTSDYEQIDFVLLQRVTPEGEGKGLTQKQVGVRPRVLTVDRRNPDPVALRVLRRFSYTELDPFAQFDKLVSAFSVAEWSEPLFNNRALFSDYYLKFRVPDEVAWKDDPKPAYQKFLTLFAQAPRRWGRQSIKEVSEGLLEPAFLLLGFGLKRDPRDSEGSPSPHYHLYHPENKNPESLAVCLTYPWGRSLDGKDEARDKDKPNENPGQIVVSLLEKGEAPWAIVTNGKYWRLYSAKAHSRAMNYYEIDLEETLFAAADPSEIFRYFWLLFRREAFEAREVLKEGETQKASFLDLLFEGSEEYARELGERLKERVFEEIFPHFARGFIGDIRRKEADVELNQETLDKVFQGTLTFLYRLLFLLYAEARDLFPVKEVRGYWEKSLSKLKEEVGHAGKKVMDEAPGNLKKAYEKKSMLLYDRLSELFRIIDRGDHTLNVPLYNGGLFLTNPDVDDASPEAQSARFLSSYKIPDQFLALGLDFMARDLDDKTQALAFIDYKSLGVRQLGSIYEGLLEFKLRIATEKMAVVKGKKTEEVVPYREAQKEGRKILTKGRGKDAEERIYPRGGIYLENDRRERKATGSYYTPDHIVKYIVENAVGLVLKEKFEAITPKLREAQKAYQEAVKAWPAFKMAPGKNPELVAQRFRGTVDELFTVRILDPAMGSGHFLVESVDFITDRMLDFLNGFPWNPVQAELKRTRETILEELEKQGVNIDSGRLTDVALMKRHVLKRCIYGVDLNPMAVELAKVSLWLDCFTLGAPLSFLDHHLRCGNSLIGTSVKEVQEAIEGKGLDTDVHDKRSQYSLFGSRFAGLLLATDLMRHVGELSDVTSAQVQQSRAEYRKASDALAPFKRILDVYTSKWFGNGDAGEGRRRAQPESPAVAFLKSPKAETFINARDEKSLKQSLNTLPSDLRRVGGSALRASTEKLFFHWELEFPEVFYGPRPGTTQAIERLEGAGFDAVIGNPPYDVLASEELGYDVSEYLAFYESTPVYEPAIRGKKNLYKLFICRGMTVIQESATFSFIVPMALLGDDQSADVRRMLLEKTGLIAIEAFPQKDDPYNRVFQEAKLPTAVFVTRGKSTGLIFRIRTHRGKLIDGKSPTLRVKPSEILFFDHENASIPSCAQEDWELATRILSVQKIGRMSKIAISFQGEVNETNERKKGCLTTNFQAPIVLRGANICMYAVREPSQGEDIRLDVKKFLSRKGKEGKAFAHENERVGFQRSSPQNNFRRIIAAPISKGNFCLDTVSYITPRSCQIDLNLMIVFLNSRILEWYFRFGSTNSKVNEYQFNSLPVPTFSKERPSIAWEPLFEKGQWGELAKLLCETCNEPGVMPATAADALTELSHRIQKIEAKRVLKNRSERSHLAPASQPIQDAMDAVFFRCYGLSDDDAKYISQRLKEML